LRLEDPEEMGRLLQAVLDACSSGATGNQLITELNNAINGAIGALSPGGTQPTAATTAFGSYVSTDRRFYGLNLAGQVDDTTVRIRAVVDVKESDPKRWKLLYWRVY